MLTLLKGEKGLRLSSLQSMGLDEDEEDEVDGDAADDLPPDVAIGQSYDSCTNGCHYEEGSAE